MAGAVVKATLAQPSELAGRASRWLPMIDRLLDMSMTDTRNGAAVTR